MQHLGRLSILAALFLTGLMPASGQSSDMPNAQAQPVAVPGDGLPHPILTDVRVRRAIAYCTNRPALIASVYPFLGGAQQQALLMDTFIPKSYWAYATPSPAYRYPFDPATGRQLLEDAGWTLLSGATYRTNSSGKELALTLTTTNASFRVTWATVLESQLRDCGIRLIRNHTSASWFFGADTGLRRRDFELGAFAWMGEKNPGGRTLYTCDNIPTPANDWSGQNYMGWCNPVADQAIRNATSTLSRTIRQSSYGVAQEEFAKDMVSLPLFNRVDYLATDKNLTGFAPSAGESLYTWNVYSWTLPATTTIVIGLTQEPATLFGPQDFSFVGNLVRSLIYGVGFSNLNYDLQARLYTSVPSVENGGIVTRTISVISGTPVADVGGSILPLAPGMRVRDGAGQEVVYAGGAITMTQAVITGSWHSPLQWSDGSTVLLADLQLWDAISCDPSASLKTFDCAAVTQRTYLNPLTTRVTLVPGYLPFDVTPFMPGAYPSERTLSDGRKLKDVPTGEWINLAEVTRNPIGFGPYRLTSWQSGNRMTFTANPFFTLGAPAMPNVEIRFIGDSNLAANQLITGQIDVLGPQTTPGIESLLSTAAQNGSIATYALPSATWEHLDMNLAVFPKVFLPVIQR
jgi:ABC-type transport system substrate-binding protein